MILGNHHILVIDDNEDILSMLKVMLQFNGYQVSTKGNSHNLESYIQEIKPDIILMDMLLSGTDGRDVCKKLKADGDVSSIPVIMISAMPEADKACLKAGADYFIAKPFEINDLFEAVSVALSARLN